LRIRSPMTSPLFPYTTLFRSGGVVHVEGRVDRERVVLVGHRRVDGVEEEHALARVGGEGDEGVAELPFRLGHGHERSAAAVSQQDRKSTRLNSSHVKISYAVF